uniref:GAF domain-containing protein n=1 Tax=uncultured Sphingomonas sp. TaxID=158754 RepID=UPI0025F264D3|nr:GAF domain-containing protein [uncultured Sphingomonas sp.]
MPTEENRRLRELRAYGVLDTPNEPEFDSIVHKAASICRTPIALLSFVDERRQWFKAKVGIAVSETPRSISFCTHAIRSGEPTIVEDASRDPRLAANPLVSGAPHLRFYAGVPLRMASGARLGTLCVLDDKPRTPAADQVEELERLAAMVVALLEHRRAQAASLADAV